jgi:PleD family two-component response regulator
MEDNQAKGPRVAPRAGERESRAGKLEAAATSRGEISVVDDDPAVRDTLSMALSAGGYQIRGYERLNRGRAKVLRIQIETLSFRA